MKKKSLQRSRSRERASEPSSLGAGAGAPASSHACVSARDQSTASSVSSQEANRSTAAAAARSSVPSSLIGAELSAAVNSESRQPTTSADASGDDSASCERLVAAFRRAFPRLPSDRVERTVGYIRRDPPLAWDHLTFYASRALGQFRTGVPTSTLVEWVCPYMPDDAIDDMVSYVEAQDWRNAFRWACSVSKRYELLPPGSASGALPVSAAFLTFFCSACNRP